MAEHEMPCATGAANCSGFDEVNIDSRAGQLKLKDAPSELPIALVPFAQVLADVQPKQVRVVHPPDGRPPDAFPSRNILYCVYLI